MLRFLSDILSPPVIAAAVTVAFSALSPNVPLSMILGFLFLVAVPMLPFFYLFAKGLVNDIDVKDRKMRIYFLFIALISYIASSIIFHYLGYHAMFLISLAYVFVASAVMVANFFQKISIHSAGIAGPTTALVYVFGLGLVPLYILTVIVCHVRLKQKAHTLPQLMVGALIAIAITFTIYFFFY
ncbi:MAG: hypothetical protein WA139_02050 [Candidatus Aenigmatarchaeota archaeon]